MKDREFRKLIITAAIYGTIVMGLILSVNICVDASSRIRPRHTQMAQLILDGHTVAVPQNYNERVFQVCIVDNMSVKPGTIVIGGSRGMFIGKEITGYTDLYNNCVSGACLEDNYALLGLYQERFGALPYRVIIETSPWVFYSENPESRWIEKGRYHDCAALFYRLVNSRDLPVNRHVEIENPYLSFAYFRYNLKKWAEEGSAVFSDEAHISTDPDEAADLPDGSARYAAAQENESPERLARVRSAVGACTYKDSDHMTEIDPEKQEAFENLIGYLTDRGTEVILFLQPFSATQSRYSFDDNLNPAYRLVEDYLRQYAQDHGIELRGGYDARNFGLGDERFIDYMHLDKEGTRIVWDH